MNKINNSATLPLVLCAAFLGLSDTAEAQSNTLQSTTTQVNFTAPVGSIQQLSQAVTITASLANVNLPSATVIAGSPWLTVEPTSAPVTPATFNVRANPTGLPVGTYDGSVFFSASGIQPYTLPVKLFVQSGPSLTVTPGVLNFTASLGSPVGTGQSVTIGTTGGAPANYSASITQITGGNWLLLSGTSGTTGAANQLQAFANPASVSAAGNYTATVTISSPGSGLNNATLTVNLAVSQSPDLTVTPKTLSFFWQIGATAPSAQTLNVSATSGSIQFNATAGTANGGAWLSVAPQGALATSGSTVGLAVSVSAQVLGTLVPGTYQGTVTLSAPTAATQNVSIPVTLTVSTNPLLVPTPTSLSFTYQFGAAIPPNQNITLTTTSPTPLGFTASVSTQSGGSNWLTIGQPTGAAAANAPATVSIGVAPGTLGAGTYNGTVTISAPGAGNPSQTIPVTLTVSTNPLINVTPGALSFAYQVNGGLPSPQTVNVGSTGAPLNYSVAAAGGNWLQVVPTAGTTPGAFQVSALPAGLTPANYSGIVTVTATGADNSPREIPVKLVVATTPLLVASPQGLTFRAELNSTAAQFQNIAVTSTDNSAINFNATAATATAQGWLLVSPGGTTGPNPASIGVTVNPAGLPVGTYTGSISIAGNVQNSPVTVAVTLIVSASASLSVTPASLTFVQNAGAPAPPTQTVRVTASGNATLTFSASTTTQIGSWLTLTPTTGSTPADLTITANGTQLSPGSYTGSVTIVSPGAPNSPLNVPVTLVVTAPGNMSLSPASLAFTHQAGAATPPAAQGVAVSVTGGQANFTAAAATTGTAQGWLSVTPTSGVTPQNLSISVAPQNLAPGAYSGTVTVVVPGATNTPQTVQVTLTVGAGITLNPASLSYSYRPGDPVPAPRTIEVTTPSPVNFTAVAAIQGAGNWLSVDPASGRTPASFTVRVNPAGLIAGTYNGSVTVTPATGSAVTLNVTLTVGAPNFTPVINAVVNAASLQPADLSGGLLFTIFGTSIGPTVGVSFSLTPQGAVPAVLGDARVFVDDIPAAMLFARADQINAILPYAVANRAQVSIRVEYFGVRSEARAFRVAEASPAIFTLGGGQGAILNQNFSVNGAGNPAARGSIVTIYATGEGQTTPAGVDYSVTGVTPPFRRPVLPVTVFIGGVEAVQSYAGAAPAIVAGVLQLNVAVPANVGPGVVPVQIRIGNVTSPSGVTMVVQ
ncbi:MAG: BACON domain-containing protein [Bryobacteraceae bacterium]